MPGQSLWCCHHA